ncbi:nucleotidyltransferase family protein [Amycolatopsis taiwanensis]|uniref:Nucleotidyltransferase n=1 Tax=Amycolatopsis taiwanensis TaxID=342230 RepID=A0A9W6VH24_9PSEU|nr:nucleotidyltransferase family protein [Amycolatopsis taiwanensis]GLY71468.1 nucleotidyltransferase [Amycolatopsis taiwanensis]
MAALAVDETRLSQICARYGIATLRVFGSVARGDDTSSSDIDILYELQPGTKLGWKIEDLNRELTDLFGRPVDLVSKKSLHPLLRDTAINESRRLYAA